MRLMEFVLKISEPRLRLWASKNSHSKEQEMKIILSTFNLSTAEAWWSYTWRLCHRLHWSLLNQSAAIFVPAEVIQKICSLCRFSSWSAIFQESVHQASSPNVRSESNLEEKPNRSRWSHSWRFIKFILKLWRNQRLMLKPSSQWRLTRKRQLLFRGSLLGQLEKKAINQGGDCWVKNMVYTLLF